MKSDKAEKIARWCSADEVQKWTSGVGRFVAGVHPHLNAELKKVCGACPFRNLLNVGGCLNDDCPVHQVLHTLNRAVPRAASATKEIYKAKYSRKSA